MTSGGTQGGFASQEWAVNIVPTGNIDGVNTTFTVLNSYYAGTMMVYLRGLRKTSGVDFTETSIGFVMVAPPQVDDALLCDYRKI